MTDAAPIGHNLPPDDADEFRARLELDAAALLDEASDLELDAFSLPKEVQSDDDVAKINAHVLRGKDLIRRFEAARKETKDPFFRRAQAVDDLYNGEKESIGAKLATIERRSIAYLQAKQAREKAAAEAEARARQIEAQRLADEAAAAKRKEEEAARAREAAEAKVREEERAKAQADADARRAGENVVPISVAAPTAAELELRRANQEAESAGAERQRLEEQSRVSTVAAERAEKKTEATTLGRTQGGGGAAKVKMVWEARVTSYSAMMESLGPLADFIKDAEIADALGRAAKANPQPTIPGVDYIEVPEVRTTATRS